MTRRAPRLGPGERIGRHLRRPGGRFARIDPQRARPLPALSRLLGAATWAGLLAYAGWKAWRGERGQEDG